MDSESSEDIQTSSNSVDSDSSNDFVDSDSFEDYHINCSENPVMKAEYPKSELNNDDSLIDDSLVDHSLSDDISKGEIFKLLWTMNASDSLAKDRGWLMKVQIFILFHFSQDRGLDEVQLDKLLYVLSSISSSLSDREFFKLTKALAPLCIVSDEVHLEGTDSRILQASLHMENINSKVLQASFLRGLFYCSIKCGYLNGANVNTINVDNGELLQMVPSFTEASFQCFVSLILPSTSILIDHNQLRQLMNLVQIYQLPLYSVKEAITNNCNSPHLMIKSLKKSIEQRSEKGLEQLIHELSQSKLLSEDMLKTIKECLSSEKLESMQQASLTNVREALIRIANGTSSVLVDDMILAVACLSDELDKTMKYKPRLTQLISLCILLLSCEQKVNCLLEVLTGEGKSCIIAMFAAALAMQGRKVDVVTSSPVLAKRDAANWAKFYEKFELTATHNTDTVELLTMGQSMADKKRADVYCHNIVYGTVSSFSADILREEFEMREVRSVRGFQTAIIDEVDMLMMDEGVQFTYLSHRLAVLRHIEPILGIVWSAVQQHSPLTTEGGTILFAEIPKCFPNVIFDGIDTSEYPEFQEMEKKAATEYLGRDDMLVLIEQINTSGASYVKAYILNEDSKLVLASKSVRDEEEEEEEEEEKEEEHMSVLVLDKGRVCLLCTQEELTKRVKRIVSSQCDISDQDVLQTTVGTVYHPGDPGAFDEILSDLNSLCSHTLLWNIAQNNIKKVLESVYVKERVVALENVKIQEMVSFIEQLNASQSDFSVVAYTQDGNGKLRQATESSTHHQDSLMKTSVLIKDKGILHPLYTLDEANANQKDVFYALDGATFHYFGVPHSLEEVVSKCLDPLQLLQLIAEYGIAKEKVKKVLDAKDKKSRKEAIESFGKEDMLDILKFLKQHLPCRITEYTSLPHVLEHEDSLCVLVMEKGKVCLLHTVHDKDIEGALLTPEGSKVLQGPTDFFHNVLCAGMGSELLYLLMKHDLQDDSIIKMYSDARCIEQPIQKQDVLNTLTYLEKYLRFKLVVYTIDGQNQETFIHKPASKIEATKPEFPVLLLKNGMLCRLQTKEKIPVPSFLKDFVISQLPTYIDSAFTAHLMTENREYLLSADSKILPIDYQNSGIIEANKRWGGGLQQMLEMKHHLELSPMSVITNFLSHIGFFRRYKKGTLFGLSGTIGADSDFKVLMKLYNFHPCRIPTFCRRLLYERDPVFVEGDRNDWMNKIYCVLKEVTSPKSDITPSLPGGAALVLCEDIRTAEEINKYLNEKGQRAVLYTRSDLKESESFEEIPRDSGDIIVATNLAGRGTDIKLTDSVNQSGGLFCLMTFLPRNRRVELQAFGRTARKGNPGSVQCILAVSALPVEYHPLPEISVIRKAREEVETARLECMVESDVQEVLLRERLFHKHCIFLESIHRQMKTRKDKQMIIDTINENWGLWLQNKQQAIVLGRESLLNELDAAHKRWIPSNPAPSTAIILHLPDCNFHQLVKFGNQCLFHVGVNRKSIQLKDANEAFEYYTIAIKKESKFTMVAHYNRACCRLITAKEDYMTESMADLRKAKELLQVYVDEVITVSLCTKTGVQKAVAHDVSDDHFNKQMKIRMQVLQYFKKQIDETLKQLEQLKRKKEDAEIIPTSILEFIPEADIVTNEELYSLKLLGLEISFSVKKKPKFNWEAFGVFLLGIGQIVAGACLAVFTVGTLSSVGMGLITEGVSDCIEGAVGMITGDFDIKDWAISKACNIAISVAAGGVGKVIAKGAKAAVKGVKTAKGVRSGAKAFTKGVKMAAKGPVKAVAQDVKVIGKVARGSWGKALKTNMKTVGKLVGKELISQVAMTGLNKLENLAIKEVFTEIGRKVAHSFQESLQKSFSSSRENDLGHIVDCMFCSKIPSPVLEKEAQQFFASVADEVVAALVQSKSSVFEKISTTFRDELLPRLSEHLKGKAEVVFRIFEHDSISKTMEQLKCLEKEFQPEMVKCCEAHLQKTDDSQPTDECEHMKKLKIDLAKHTADKVCEAVTTVLQQNLSWILNHELSAAVNKVAKKHLNKRLDVEGTKIQITHFQKANYVCYMPSCIREHVDVQHMKLHAEKIPHPDTPGTLAELKVLVEKLNCKVVIEDKDGKRNRSLESHSSDEKRPKITLVHTPPDKQHPLGHYDVKINGETIAVRSEGNGCMFEALAIGLKDANKGDHGHDAQSLRNIVSDEISKHPELWHDHFERKEQLHRIKNGNLHLLEGGAIKHSAVKPKASGRVKHGAVRYEAQSRHRPVKHIKNKGTAIDDYAREMLDKTTESIMYKQKNGLEVTSIVVYDREPVGREKSLNPHPIPVEQTWKHVDNDINVMNMKIRAKNCNFDNVGRCLHTLPSFKQLSWERNNRPKEFSSPVSFHLIASAAGGNAGTFTGNSVVASEWYNRKEAEVRNAMKKDVDKYYKNKNIENKTFCCEVSVEFENLIPPGGMKEFVKQRNNDIKEKDPDLSENMKRKPIKDKNIAKLEERCMRIGEIATEGLQVPEGVTPQVQRIKSLKYVVVFPDGHCKSYPDLGCDTELYVHSLLTGDNSGYKNEDLEHAKASRKKLLTGLYNK